MYCLVNCRILFAGANVTRRAFQTRNFAYFTLISCRFNGKASLGLCLSLNLPRFNELSLLGVPGTVVDFRKRSLSIPYRILPRDMAHKKSKTIPDRWTDYQALGKRIPGTRLIAFKVPLKQSLQKCLPPAMAFDPFELVRLLEEEKEELGLIIDLTFTTRYYKPTDLPDSVHYLKIFTAGHAVPNDRTILSFKKAVQRFLQENGNNDKLIGVHCTHGLNRTGYLVCRYLIDVDGMAPREAVKRHGDTPLSDRTTFRTCSPGQGEATRAWRSQTRIQSRAGPTLARLPPLSVDAHPPVSRRPPEERRATIAGRHSATGARRSRSSATLLGLLILIHLRDRTATNRTGAGLSALVPYRAHPLRKALKRRHNCPPRSPTRSATEGRRETGLERETETETETETERQRDRETETQRERERERVRVRSPLLSLFNQIPTF